MQARLEDEDVVQETLQASLIGPLGRGQVKPRARHPECCVRLSVVPGADVPMWCRA